MPKLIGIDYGSKRVGVAMTDDSGSVAFPKDTLPNNKNLVSTVATLIRSEQASVVVIGESKDAYGKDNAIMTPAREFADAIRSAASVPVHFEPEFYSSSEARRDTNRSAVDAEAATIILNSYIARTKPS